MTQSSGRDRQEDGAKRRKRPRPAKTAGIVKHAVLRTSDDTPPGYDLFLADLKDRIRAAQVRAALAVNAELVRLYWTIGHGILVRQERQGWGAKVIDRLAADLTAAFPGMEGFSRSNVYRMRSFYRAWSGGTSGRSIVAQVVRQSDEPRHRTEIVAQPVGQLVPDIPREIASLPWGHNVILVEKLADPAQRLWYAHQTIEHGWSRAVLVHWIESGLYSRQGKAVNNFHSTLPPGRSDLARQLLKDPYNFDFLTLAPAAAERDLERGLLEHIRRFLIELGAGFAFVGQQVPIEVGGDVFSIDLLFYHLRLRCFVVVDLKVEAFKPEFAGKMNFYLSAADDLMRHPDDEPSIGLILCRTAKRTVAEYALRDLAKPVGIARYVTRLVETLPPELAGALPSEAQLRMELEKASSMAALGGGASDHAKRTQSRRRLPRGRS